MLLLDGSLKCQLLLQAIHVALPGKKVDQAIPEDTVTVVKLKECPSGKVR